MNDNVNINAVDLSKNLQTDRRVGGFLNSIRALSTILDELGTTIAMMNHAEQRFLCQIIAWRMMGGAGLPATQGLVHMPLLVGMGFETIQIAAEKLVESDVIQQVPTEFHKNGDVKAMAFFYPVLEKLLKIGQEIAQGPQIKDLQGRNIRSTPK